MHWPKAASYECPPGHHRFLDEYHCLEGWLPNNLAVSLRMGRIPFEDSRQPESSGGLLDGPLPLAYRT